MTHDEWRIVFGDNLKSILQDYNMSQNELATITGLSPGTISDYVNGWAAPSIFSVVNIAHALDVDIDELVDTGDNVSNWKR